MPGVLALDIGGANLKLAHTSGMAESRPFAVWKDPAGLGPMLSQLLRSAPPFSLLAVTTTAELCDCFPSKAAGVRAVLDAVEHAAEGWTRPIPLRVWQSDGRLVPMEDARRDPIHAAAANWLALASWAGRWAPDGPALLIDIGSTTTDLVPLQDGAPVPRGRTDLERLGCGELVYSGVRRTPVCALVQSVRLTDRDYRVAAELFATTLDAYLLLGDLAAAPGDLETADGSPATRLHAASRLARVLCAEPSALANSEIEAIASQVAAAQLRQLTLAAAQVIESLGTPPRSVIVSGSGEFLARRLVEQFPSPIDNLVEIRERLGNKISSAACAYALAVLAQERCLERIES